MIASRPAPPSAAGARPTAMEIDPVVPLVQEMGRPSDAPVVDMALALVQQRGRVAGLN
jgi:hypothetical protein